MIKGTRKFLRNQLSKSKSVIVVGNTNGKLLQNNELIKKLKRFFKIKEIFT